MKILLSAYACEPNKGSEPGVGWHWAHEIEKLGHQVWVLTRLNNKPSIESYYKEHAKPERLNFIYYDVPKWLSFWKKGGRGVHLYYLFWQIGAYFVAKNAHVRHKFDRVQHITFVTARQPSFMGALGIPFILGPVAGGERAPWRLRYSYSWKGFIKDFIRDIANLIVKFDPMMHFTFTTASEIYVTSKDTQQLIPSRYQSKIKVQLAIGLDISVDNRINTIDNENRPDFKILYVGQFRYLKGMDLGLRAFAEVVKRAPKTTLTLVGKGEEELRWKHLAGVLGLSDNVVWLPWQVQKDLEKIYRQHDAFFFPSLHDSGGLVVLEAMSNGLPVVSLDIGGPGQIVDKSCGYKIKTKNVSERKVVSELSKKLLSLVSSHNANINLVNGAHKKATEMNWKNIVQNIYDKVGS